MTRFSTTTPFFTRVARILRRKIRDTFRRETAWLGDPRRGREFKMPISRWSPRIREIQDSHAGMGIFNPRKREPPAARLVRDSIALPRQFPAADSLAVIGRSGMMRVDRRRPPPSTKLSTMLLSNRNGPVWIKNTSAMQPLHCQKIAFSSRFLKIPQRSVRGWVCGYHVPKKCHKALINKGLRFLNMIPTFEKLGIMLWVPCCGGRGLAQGNAGVEADFHQALCHAHP